MQKRPTTRLLVSIVVIVVAVLGSLDRISTGSANAARGSTQQLTAERASSSNSQSCPEQSLLPAYFYPGATWQAALASTSVGSTIIVNPSSGPGTASDPQYQQVVAGAKAKGAQLFGYIDTMHAAVPLSFVEQQINEYRTWYGIDNIFLDNASSLASDLGYYQVANSAVHSADSAAIVMLNPGDYPDQSYMSLGDLVIDFEGPYSSFVAEPPPSWVYNYPASMFGSLVSAVPESQISAVLGLAASRNSSYVYLTDDATTATLYEALPTYWTTELDGIQALCQSGEGYRMASANGGVFSFGDARFYGSTGALTLNKPIVGMATTSDGGGYWLVASDGGVFSFGDARFYGSGASIPLGSPAIAIN